MVRSRKKCSRLAFGSGLLLGLGGLAVACGSKTGLPTPLPCTSYAAGAELAPLDVFIALDTSGSMDFQTANGQTKYAAISQALGQFLHDKDSAGIGVTIAFFPQTDDSIPEYCGSSGDCGAGNTCFMISTCVSNGTDFCHTPADCSAGDSCEAVGRCSYDPTVFCYVNGNVGCASGYCVPAGVCPNHYACDPARYQPVLPVADLPGAADAVLSAVDSQLPLGGTPTLPALLGSTNAAEKFAAKHLDHKVIVLLATDGLPTVCDPAVDPLVTDPKSGIPKLVNAAQDAAQKGIQTFVIGVFAPDEEADAQANLGQIAQAGGGGDAFIISTETDVSQSFLTTLNQIRRAAKACEFSIPSPNGTLLDATRMAVSIEASDGSKIPLVPRDSEASCDPTSGGFYFDRDPLGPTPPGRITLCPASCQLAEQGTRPVDLEVDCNQSRWVYP